MIIDQIAGQIIISPVIKKNKTSNARVKQVQNSQPLELPFWDDFSRAKERPDTALWIDNEAAVISSTIGINAPTVNVVTFDGWDAFGRPYGSNTDANGLGDELLSKPIDLSDLSEEEKKSLFLSFYYQAQGLGEKPDPDDSLRLQFKSSKDKWYTQWVRKGESNKKGQFSHIMPILIEDDDGFETDETFFHPGFQFRFQVYGYLSGNFDVWHIDYVYLNTNRNPVDTVYFDRALTSEPTSLFKNYFTIPLEHFRKYPDKYLGSPKAGFYNLSSTDAIAIDFSSIVSLAGGEEIISFDTLNFETELSPLPAAFERRSLKANAFNTDKLSLVKDSVKLTLETKFYINSKDTVYKNRNFLINDTVRTIQEVDNYFAYDDGSAEFAAGVGKRGAKLAYQYVLPEQDTITAIDIYFPNFVHSQNASTIKLMVWDGLDNEEASILHQETFPVQPSEILNQLKRYQLRGIVVVKDTFYIGYEQNIDEVLSVGFDHNTDSRDKIFFNNSALGSWQSFNEVGGSLMMRPVFNPVTVTGIREPFPDQPRVNIYPNPTGGRLYIMDEYDRIKIFNSQGQKISFYQNKDYVDITGNPKGIYIIQIEKDQQVTTRKILLN